MEKAIALNRTMYAQALKTPGLRMVMGTDAVAGAHGQNAREAIERVRQGQRGLSRNQNGDVLDHCPPTQRGP
jgi:hypothetical protein